MSHAPQWTSLRAIVPDGGTSTDALELGEVEPPEIGDDDVLVRVHAAGVGPSVSGSRSDP